jgi:ABC-type transport system substrate-binding protein
MREHTNQPRQSSQATRRGVLKTGMSTAVGLGATSLASVEPQVALAAPQGKQGGHGYVLNYAYPESWDPHISGTLAANAAISPIYNQVVEFNPLNPKEVIGDLAKSWDVSDDGTASAAIKANKIVMTTAANALSIEDMVKLGANLKGKVSLYWQPEVTDG